MTRVRIVRLGPVLTFVTADEASMDVFLTVSAASASRHRLRDYAASLVQQGTTRAEWCLVGLDAGRPVARGALWALPEHPVPTDIVLIDADWSEPDLVGGRELVNELHELARAFGADVLSHSVDAPPNAPQYQENEADRVRLLERSGYNSCATVCGGAPGGRRRTRSRPRRSNSGRCPTSAMTRSSKRSLRPTKERETHGSPRT